MTMKRKGRRSRASEHRAFIRAHRKFYDALLELQGGTCAICGKPPGERRHALDHDHKPPMRLLGILCFRCNAALRYWVTPEWLRAAADYLENPPFERLEKDID